MPTPEQMLRLARSVYPKITWSITDGCVHATRDLLFRFHPLHDAEQFVAVEERMGSRGTVVVSPPNDDDPNWYATLHRLENEDDFTLRTRPKRREAVIACACAVAERLKGEGE